MPDIVNNILKTSIHKTDSTITLFNRWDHFLARFGINRSKHRVKPGLYALGQPTKDSTVFVTANYTLSFDALRTALAGIDAFILVLDTKGINVWCAAGKGTFSTNELVRQIEQTSLKDFVLHRKLLLPQLGATGITAHEVKKRTGFRVEYGPVRATDLPAYLDNQEATPEMRRIYFNLKDRLILIPVEIVGLMIPMLVASSIAYFLGGLAAAIGVIAAVLAGIVLFPIFLPWIPTCNFSTKGFIVGWTIILPFALLVFFYDSNLALWQKAAQMIAYMLTFPAITAFLTLNFTGSTTFTSKSGVKKEIFTYIPVMAWMFGIGIVISITLSLINLLGN
jgi:hypothetical protein